MKHIENLTYYIANFIDELVADGVTEAIISPGSRSTPLAMTISEHPNMKEWVLLDERSAAFFALGMARKNKRPVVLVCTSGTAAANYFPAIVEAHYSRIPLIVCTADRPHELRDVGAPQAINQINLYGDYVKWFHEMALPEGSTTMLQYVRAKAFQSVQTAREGNPGVVHLNFPIREPHIPDFTLPHLWGEKSTTYYQAIEGNRQVDLSQVNEIIKQTSGKKGLLVCGPQVNTELASKLVELASHWQIPILADPLSGIRNGDIDKTHIIEGYDAFFRDETVRKHLRTDFIIRFGAMPVSKAYMFYVQEHKDVLQYVVEEHTGFREPVGNKTSFVYADSVHLCEMLIKYSIKQQVSSDWFNMWRKINDMTKKQLQLTKRETTLTVAETEALTEGETVKIITEHIPENTTLYSGNSMAIRDLDTFFMTMSKEFTVLANRGANGIDGMTSSAAGAAALGERVTLLVGDLSFFHDMNGLLAIKQYQLNITVVLINNNGGGIFSFLPQRMHQNHFEALFGTPLDIDFKQAATMYGGTYQVANTRETFVQALMTSYKTTGLSVIEVQTNREQNRVWHQDKWQAIAEELLGEEETNVLFGK